LILMWPLKIGGLALATSLAAVTNFVMLYVMLTRRIGDLGTAGIVSSFVRTCLAAVVMGLAILGMSRIFLPVAGVSGLKAFAALGVMISISAVVYFISAYMAGVEGVKRLWALVLARRK